MEERLVHEASRWERTADQRLAIMVDVQNMFYSAKYQYNKKLDFRALMDTIVKRRRLIRAVCYVVKSPDIDQTSFLSFLTQAGYEIRIKNLKFMPDGSTKGDWDMGIAIESIAIAEKVDVIALVSGDGDFCALVEMLKARGVRVEVYSFPSNTAEELKASATEFFPLDANVLLYT
jgi:uncharacterized LabA/DUF88 family protein